MQNNERLVAMGSARTDTTSTPPARTAELAKQQHRRLSEIREAAEAVWVDIRGLQEACRRYG